MNLRYFIFFCLHFKEIFSVLNSRQIDISLDLAEELKIRQCILGGPDVTNSKTILSYIKNFSSAKISITYFKYIDLPLYFHNMDYVNFHTGLIFKQDGLATLDHIIKRLDHVSFIMDHIF